MIMREHRGAPSWSITWVLFAAACSATVVPPGDSGVRTDVPPTTRCPSAEPGDRTPCSDPDLQCEYGADPRRECRRVASCSAAEWRVRALGDNGVAPAWCAAPPPPAECPATIEAASGQPCGAQGAVCAYGGSLCECTNCSSFPISTCGGNATWQCDQRPLAPGCPQGSPRYGEACSQAGLTCDYGCNSPDGAVQCTGGAWQIGYMRNCPISTRALKRDITYLAPAEADALAAQVRATRLATYEYTIPAMGGRRRLGFIIEDQPASYAVDPERSEVDLYGYTSLLVATVQAQDRQIQALTRRIEGLERARPSRRSTR